MQAEAEVRAAAIAWADVIQRRGEMLVTDVWGKRDGRWQVVAHHTSMLGA